MFKKILFSIIALTVISAVCWFYYFAINHIAQAQQGSIIVVAQDNTGNYTTIQSAVDNVNPGSTILIKAGTYQEAVTITKSGTQNNPITIKNYGDGEVKIDATNMSVGIEFNACHYIDIQNLKIFGATKRLPYIDQGNVRFYNNPSNITIQRCEIYNGTRGIRYSNNTFTPEANYISIINCQIHDNELEGIYMNSATANGGGNVVISGNDVYNNSGNGIYANCNGILIQDNNIYNNNERGLRLSQSPVQSFYKSIVRRNHIHHNGKDGIMQVQTYTLIYENDIHHNGLDFTTAALHGIYMAQTDYNIIYNNKIYNHKDGSAIRSEGFYNVIKNNELYNNGYGLGPTNRYGESYANIIRNNLIYNSLASLNQFNWPVGSGMEADGNKEIHFFNNLVFNNQGYGAAFVEGHDGVDSTGAKLKNNIIMNSGNDWEHIRVTDPTVYQENNNDIYSDKSNAVKYGNSSYNLAAYKSASGQGTHSISQNPLFQNPNNGNFHVQSNSPVIDKGGFLTKTTSSGSGTQIRVEDAKYFCDGFGIAEGDIIQLENQTQTAKITDINYDNNTISVDRSLTWIQGQGMSLAYQGSAPDIGVYEYGSTPQQPDITLTKTADKIQVQSGDEIKYTIHYQNTSQIAAYNVIITDQIPANTTYLSGGLVSGNTVTWNLGNLNAGQQGDVELRVRVE